MGLEFGLGGSCFGLRTRRCHSRRRQLTAPSPNHRARSGKREGAARRRWAVSERAPSEACWSRDSAPLHRDGWLAVGADSAPSEYWSCRLIWTLLLAGLELARASEAVGRSGHELSEARIATGTLACFLGRDVALGAVRRW